MKLIKRTYSLALLGLIPVLIAGSIFCFFMIEYISYEEADEYLSYEMARLVEYHQQNNDLPEFHKVADILPGVRYEQPFLKDTFLLEPADSEMVPYRELYFTINHKGTDFTIVLRHLLPGRDDIAEGALMIISGLMLLIALTIILLINLVNQRLWKPFYNTLHRVTGFRIGNRLPVFDQTAIDEFKTLNDTLQGLLKKIDSDYHRNKEFNENLSHELQTHLAIIRSNTEVLLDEASIATENPDKLQLIYSAVTKLSQVQKSLLLLSKISNMEYANPVDTALRPLVEQALDFFSEALQLREITLQSQLNDCSVRMDAGLATVLVNNLIKNAVKHNIHQGFLAVTLQPSLLIIENSGAPYPGDPQKLMERFVTGPNGHYGIGLSIVKQICELYHFTLSYTISEKAVHQITLRF